MIKGSIVHRVIRGKDRYYHQWRENGKTLSRYLKPDEVLPLRQALEAQNAPEAGVGTDPIGEAVAATRRLPRRTCVDDVLEFLRDKEDSRILVLHGLDGAGKTTIIRQALGKLTPKERADISLRTMPVPIGGFRQVKAIETTPLTLRDFQSLTGSDDLALFIEYCAMAGVSFPDRSSARAFVAQLAGPDAWRTVEAITLPFLGRVLRSRTAQSPHHSRAREAAERQRMIAAIEEMSAAIQADDAILEDLTSLDVLSPVKVEVLRPAFSIRNEHLFTMPSLRFRASQDVLTTLLDGEQFASLGAAERKQLLDDSLVAVREATLDDAIFLEKMRGNKSDDTDVVRTETNGRLAMVIADRNELSCELFVTRLTDVRDLAHLNDLMDYRFLDAVEHRHGIVADRIVLYKGRDARHPSGVSYRNIGSFLARL